MKRFGLTLNAVMVFGVVAIASMQPVQATSTPQFPTVSQTQFTPDSDRETPTRSDSGGSRFVETWTVERDR